MRHWARGLDLERNSVVVSFYVDGFEFGLGWVGQKWAIGGWMSESVREDIPMLQAQALRKTVVPVGMTLPS